MADAGPQVPAVPAPQLPSGHQLQQPTQQVQAHLLRTNYWMDTHQFQEGVKVQRFSLTLVGEARLWYESLRPIIAEWQGLQNQFRQQYSK